MKESAAKVMPKADQPMARSSSVERGQQPAKLEYRVQGVRSLTKTPTRGYDRSQRG